MAGKSHFHRADVTYRTHPRTQQQASRIVSGSAYDLWTDDFADTGGRGIAQVRLDYLHFGANKNTFDIGTHNGLRITGFTGGGAGAVDFSPWIPTQLAGAAHRSQFSEAVYLADNGTSGSGNGVRGGLCCAVAGDSGPSTQTAGGGFNQGYFLVFVKESTNMAVQRSVNCGSPVNLITGLSVSINDLVQLRTTFQGGSVLIEVFRNGSSVGSATDSSVPLEKGLPGLWHRQMGAGKNLELGSLRCGVISKA